MSKILMPFTTQAATNHTATTPPSTPVRTVHIDRLHVTGPLDHEPLGELFYKVQDGVVVPVGASAFKPNAKRNPDEVYIRSKKVQSCGRANMLEIDCCPPKILQGHNFFGHGDLQDYTYAMFDRQTSKFGLDVDPGQREMWQTGHVGVTGVHLCANFWCEPGFQLPFIEAIDHNNKAGKHRDEETCITLGFTPKERSKYHCATAYAKDVLLRKEWKRPGPLQTRIIRASERSFRVEIKLYSQLLDKESGLGYVMRWKDVDVNEIFFKILARHNIANSFQPLLTEDERQMLSNAEQRAYLLWLNGASLSDYFGRTTVWRYTKTVLEKTGIDMSAHRRPEKLPLADLREILVPENIVPIPQWAYEHPDRYWAPGRALSEPALKSHSDLPDDSRSDGDLCVPMGDPELELLAL